MKIKISIEREQESHISFLRTIVIIKDFIKTICLKKFIWSLGITYELTINGKKKNKTSIDIAKIIYEQERITVDEANSYSRKREIVFARQVAMYFSKNLTGEPLSIIGSNIGGKDHATVLHACKTINNLIDTDKKIREKIDKYSRMLS